MFKTMLTACCLLAAPAAAQTCGPDKLGVSREIAVGAPAHLGLKTYPQTLALEDHEVVLTFDDGPAPTTAKVLDALKNQCAKATFFLIGRNAAALPALARREISEGHSVGSHSFSHPEKTLRALSESAGLAEIDKGAAAVAAATNGRATRFFRFPGFGDTPALLAAVDARKMPVFGADLWASDWNVMTPDQELDLLMGRLRKTGRGVILLHDIKAQTAGMLPAFLARLKAEGFHLVHLVPGETTPPLREAPAGWTSETDRTLTSMKIRPPANKM